MITRIVLLAALAGVCLLPGETSAAQYQSGGQVIHTRMAPVVVHRIFPPYWGVHRYQRSGGIRRGR